jgi:hypothetical protein
MVKKTGNGKKRANFEDKSETLISWAETERWADCYENNALWDVWAESIFYSPSHFEAQSAPNNIWEKLKFNVMGRKLERNP